MNRRWIALGVVLLTAGMVVSCSSSEKKSEATAAKAAPAAAPAASSAARGSRSVAVVPGEAGGVIEDTFTASATVTAVDQAKRRITLKSSDGTEASFTAPAEVRNFDQIRVGDRVNATIKERLTVFVTRAGTGAAPAASYAEVEARAPKGAKPGAMVGESYEVVAKVTSIDAKARTATLQFAGGQTRTVPVRDDVDLNRYKVGDSVVIRASEQLTILVQTP